MLGLFDRPVDEQTFAVLLKSPVIPGLTESLTDLQPTEWQRILAKLRRARLLAREDPHNAEQLDTHPLVREYFGEQLRNQQMDAWKECNRRLFYYYQKLAPQQPNTVTEMEPLFSAVICGCNAGLFREALHEVYMPRIQRGNACFAANVLGATGPLLSALVHFFEHGRWGSLVETAIVGQSLTAEDKLFVLMQAALYLAATRGMAGSEVRICYDRAEPLCHSLDNPRLMFMLLVAQWRHSNTSGKLSEALRIAERLYSLAQEQNDPTRMIDAYRALAITLYFLGEFETARQFAIRGIEIWRTETVQSQSENLDAPAATCLCYEAMCAWHFGQIAASRPNVAEAVSLSKEMNDMHGLASTLYYAGSIAYHGRNRAEVERFASDVIELATRQHFAHWLALGSILRGWARSASGDTTEGVSCIEDGIRDYRATGAMVGLPYLLGMKAEALHLADRTSEALEAIREAEALGARSGERRWCAELHRLPRCISYGFGR
jgi:hypothetical protein